MQPSQPAGPNQYDFILNKQQPPQQKFALLNNLSKPVLILAVVVVLMLIIIVLSLVLKGGSGGGSQQMLTAAARASEIARVSGVVIQQPASDNTKALAATAQVTLTSEVNDLTAYLQSHGTKIGSKTLLINENTGTDSQMKTAAQNNSLDRTYSSYLRQQLNDYLTSLTAAYKSAGPQAKQVISSAYSSAQVLLSSPQLASSQ